MIKLAQKFLLSAFLSGAAVTIVVAAELGPRWTPQVTATKSAHPRFGIDWSQEIIYFVLIDRFFNGDSTNDKGNNPHSSLPYRPETGNLEALKTYQGGDLAGVLQKLDYIADLGFTALWLSPVFDNEDQDFLGWWPYHGYFPIDFFSVDEHFGDLELLRRVVKEAHRRGIKVILDMIYNHAAPSHPWVINREYWEEQGYRFWFHPRSGVDASTSISDWQNQEQLENYELNGLPDWAQENPHVYEFMLDYSKFWILQTDCDGYRLDAVKHVPREFWRRLCRDLHEFAGPDFLLLGEVFSGDVSYVASYQDLGFNALFDIPMYYTVQRVFAQGAPIYLLSDMLIQQQSFRNILLSRLLDNHDVARFSYATREYTQQKIFLALSFLWSLNGPPVLYYGTEVPLPGAPPQHETTGESQDYLNRLPMPWKDIHPQSYLPAGIRRLNRARRGSPALQRGRIYELYKDYGFYCYLKYTAKDARLIVLNNSAFAEERRIFLPSAIFGRRAEFYDELNDRGIKTKDSLTIRLDPYGAAYLRPRRPLRAAVIDTTKSWCSLTPRLTRDFQLVRFRLADHPSFQNVYIAGDFNGWSPTHDALQRRGGWWEIELPLRPGKYRYKFVVNGSEWLADPSATEYELDPYGGKNSVRTVEQP
ncbi:MAG: alpha-amylase family glycosyl hydrolase [candidate division KSB1 bacterium]|nr:alpha-amylase family glycosyl hydrolase [candidate division KSB1 bacterium]